MNLLLLLLVINADANAGVAGFDFLRIPPTAREAALGGAAVASATSPLGFWYSPANAGTIQEQRAQFGYLNYVAGIHVGSLAYAQPLSGKGGAGIGIVYLNSGMMKRTNERAENLGTFSASYAGINASAALQPIERLTIGLGLQGLYGSIDTFFSLGVIGSAGANYNLPLAGARLGLAVTNAGFQVKAFGAERDPMPLDIGVGASYQPNPALTIAIDVHKPWGNDLALRAGIEGWVAELLALRLGYNSTGSELRYGSGADVLAGLTTGIGIRFRGYELDYCFVPMVQLGAAHRISLTLSL